MLMAQLFLYFHFLTRSSGPPPGVQVEGEGGAGDEGDGLYHAGQCLAKVQALGHQSRVTYTKCGRRHLHTLE